PDVGQFLLDGGELLSPIRILEDERLAHAHRLAVDEIGASPTVVLDPEVVAKREQLLAHLVVLWTTPTLVSAATQQPITVSTSHRILLCVAPSSSVERGFYPNEDSFY